MNLRLHTLSTSIENIQIRYKTSPAPAAVGIYQDIITRSDSAFSASVAQTLKIGLNICVAVQFSVVKIQASAAPHSTIVSALNDDDSSRWASSFECLRNTHFVD